MSDCPICYTKMTTYEDVIDVYNGMGPTSEHYDDCPNKCYSYSYSFGSTDVYINIRGNHIRFGWSYSDSRDTLYAQQDAINVAIEAARRAQMEDYWNLVHGRSSQQGNPTAG